MSDKIKRLSSIRRLSQGFGLFLGLLGLVVPSMTHIVYPGLHCYACPLSVTICPVGIIQNLLKTGIPIFPIAFLGLYGVLLGRWWCGWICPFGFINDIFIMLNTKQKTKQLLTFAAVIIFSILIIFMILTVKNKWLSLIPGVFLCFSLLSLFVPTFSQDLRKKINSKMLISILFIAFVSFFPVVFFVDRRPVPVLLAGGFFFIFILFTGMTFFIRKNKTFILKFIVLILTTGFAVIAADTLFCKICPSAGLSAALPYLITNPDFIPGSMYWIKLGILIFTVLCLLFISRFFCRYLCPLGALFGLANKISFLKINRNRACDSADKKICKHACLKSCIMGIKDIHKQKVLTQTDCIKCGKCIEACPNSYLHFGIKG